MASRMQQAAKRCQRLLGDSVSQQTLSYALAAGHDILQASRLAAALEALTPLRSSAFWSMAPSAPCLSTSQVLAGPPASVQDNNKWMTEPILSRTEPHWQHAAFHRSSNVLQSPQAQLAHGDEETLYPVDQPVRFPFHARAFFVGAALLSGLLSL